MPYVKNSNPGVTVIIGWLRHVQLALVWSLAPWSGPEATITAVPESTEALAHGAEKAWGELFSILEFPSSKAWVYNFSYIISIFLSYFLSKTLSSAKKLNFFPQWIILAPCWKSAHHVKDYFWTINSNSLSWDVLMPILVCPSTVLSWLL